LTENLTQGPEEEAEAEPTLWVEVTEDGMVCLSGEGFEEMFDLEGENWEMTLSPDEARELGHALVTAAEEAAEIADEEEEESE